MRWKSLKNRKSLLWLAAGLVAGFAQGPFRSQARTPDNVRPVTLGPQWSRPGYVPQTQHSILGNTAFNMEKTQKLEIKNFLFDSGSAEGFAARYESLANWYEYRRNFKLSNYETEVGYTNELIKLSAEVMNSVRDRQVRLALQKTQTSVMETDQFKVVKKPVEIMFGAAALLSGAKIPWNYKDKIQFNFSADLPTERFYVEANASNYGSGFLEIVGPSPLYQWGGVPYLPLPLVPRTDVGRGDVVRLGYGRSFTEQNIGASFAFGVASHTLSVALGKQLTPVLRCEISTSRDVFAPGNGSNALQLKYERGI